MSRSQRFQIQTHTQNQTPTQTQTKTQIQTQTKTQIQTPTRTQIQTQTKTQIQTQTKTQTQPKIEKKKSLKAETGLNREEMEVLKKAFDLFDVEHTGKVDIKEIIDTLLNCGYDQLNPVLFQIIAGLDVPDNAKNGGVSFFDLVEEINSKLFDKKSKEALSNLYNIFIDDSQSIRKESLKQICEQIGKDYDDANLQEILEKLAKYGTDLTFEEFEDIIINKK